MGNFVNYRLSNCRETLNVYIARQISKLYYDETSDQSFLQVLSTSDVNGSLPHIWKSAFSEFLRMQTKQLQTPQGRRPPGETVGCEKEGGHVPPISLTKKNQLGSKFESASHSQFRIEWTHLRRYSMIHQSCHGPPTTQGEANCKVKLVPQTPIWNKSYPVCPSLNYVYVFQQQCDWWKQRFKSRYFYFEWHSHRAFCSPCSALEVIILK